MFYKQVSLRIRQLMTILGVIYNIPIELFNPIALANPSLAARALLRRLRRRRPARRDDDLCPICDRLDAGSADDNDDEPLLINFSNFRVA